MWSKMITYCWKMVYLTLRQDTFVMVHIALKQAVEECGGKVFWVMPTAAFIRFHSRFWQKNTSQYPLTENPRDRFCRTTQCWPKARSRFSGVFSFTAFLYSFPSFCLLFPNPQHPSGWLHEHNLLKCGKGLMFSLEGLFFRIPFSEIRPGGGCEHPASNRR